MRFRFVHAADLHLDTPFEGVRQDCAEAADHLRDASLRAMDNLVDLAVREKAAFLLLAGDIYDGLERGVRAQARFERALRRLGDAGIQAFIVQGNHDPLESWSGRSWPDNVVIYGAEAVRGVEVRRDSATLATVHGISFARRDVTENLARRFARPAQAGVHIGLLHCCVGGGKDHEPYSPCTLDDLQAAGMDYWALGHIHKREELSQGRPWVVYPGNLQGRSAKPSETGPKGATVVEVEDGGVRAVRFAAVDCVRFVRMPLSVTDVPDLGSLHELLERTMQEVRQANRGCAVLLRVELTGRTPLHRLLRQADAMEELLRDMRQLGARGGAVAWWEHIENRTQPMLDVDAIRRRQDFSAELMALAEQVSADAQRQAELAEACWDGLEKRGLRGRLADLPGETVAEVLADAQTIALDRLEEDGE